MRNMFGRAAVTIVASGAFISAGLTVATSANAGGITPCPSGYACLYPSHANQGPPREYYHYGVHNLHGVYGKREFINAQTGNAKAYLCTVYNGNGKCTLVKVGQPVVKNFTPINSVYLKR